MGLSNYKYLEMINEINNLAMKYGMVVSHDISNVVDVKITLKPITPDFSAPNTNGKILYFRKKEKLNA